MGYAAKLGGKSGGGSGPTEWTFNVNTASTSSTASSYGTIKFHKEYIQQLREAGYLVSGRKNATSSHYIYFAGCPTYAGAAGTSLVNLQTYSATAFTDITSYVDSFIANTAYQACAFCGTGPGGGNYIGEFKFSKA